MASPDEAWGGPSPARKPETGQRYRSLRAIFAADVAGFSRAMSIDETSAANSLNHIRLLALQRLEAHKGWLFGMPGDGLFAIFESAISAVRCGLELQEAHAGHPRLATMKLRIGIHLGEVLFENEWPYGEALAIAARLEALADPGGVLVSGSVMEAVSSRVSATFEDRGAPELKNIPRRIMTFAVVPTQRIASRPAEPPQSAPPAESVAPHEIQASGETARATGGQNLDRTTRLDLDLVREFRRQQARLLAETNANVRALTAARPDAGEAAVPTQEADQRPGTGASGASLATAPRAEVGGARDDPPIPCHGTGAAEAATLAPGVEEAAMTAKATVAPALRNALMGVDASEPPDAAVPEEPRGVDQALEKPPHPSSEIRSNDVTDGSGPSSRVPEALVEELTAALAIHLGPVAPVIVKRSLAGVFTAYDLAYRLEAYIPTEDEQLLFRMRASHICRLYL